VSRVARPPGLLALLLHTLRTEIQVPRRVLLDWAGVDEKQYARWVREGQRPDRRGREKLSVMFPHVLTYLARIGCSWDDVIDALPTECRYRSLRTIALDEENPLLVAADLDADRARGADRPEYRHASAAVAGRVEAPPSSAGFGLGEKLVEVDAVSLVYAVVAAVCWSEPEAERITLLAIQSLRDRPTDEPAYVRAYRAAVESVVRERCAPPATFQPLPGSAGSYLAFLDPTLATAVVLADQELLPLDDIAEVFAMHRDYVQARVSLGRRELLALGWLPT
jgi:hypothetical protein